MKRLELCVHCWNYSRLLCLELSSIWLNPPKENELLVTICHSLDDERTWEICEWFYEQGVPDNIQMLAHEMDTPRLLRRAIGRHEIAKATEADIVLFSDCDMLFGPGSLDAIAAAWPDGATLCYPRTVFKCPHECGDEYIASVTKPGIYSVKPTDFEPTRYRRAIGGTQWVLGDVARSKGYLPEGHRLLRPADRWMRTKEDVVARKHIAGHRGIGLDIPNVLRLRHSKYGRTHVGVEN